MLGGGNNQKVTGLLYWMSQAKSKTITTLQLQVVHRLHDHYIRWLSEKFVDTCELDFKCGVIQFLIE